MRNKIPHLCDIDGDSSHIHNASKILCEPFNMWIVKFHTSLYDDFNWSTGLNEDLGSVNKNLNLVSQCFLKTAQSKLPLNKLLLRAISAIDPAAGGYITTIKYSISLDFRNL